jgi:hypothetical protein
MMRIATPCGALAILLLAGCGPGMRLPEPAPSPLHETVWEVLRERPATPSYFERRSELREMGPEVDEVLLDMVYRDGAHPLLRSNALTLLAERGAPRAEFVLRDVLVASAEPEMRLAAVVGLQSLAAWDPAARRALFSALGDPSHRVRLNVLQAMDVDDVDAMRRLIAVERDRDVLRIARQIAVLAESRGAPLAADAEGVLRTTRSSGEPALAFQPSRTIPAADAAIGELRVELPGMGRVVLAGDVEVVGGVVPAFLSPDRSAVVFESGRQIAVWHLRRGETRVLGSGIAPRLLPFTHGFVYLRERPDWRSDRGDSTILVYDVFRAGFDGGSPRLIGEIRASARPDRRAHVSPVRWMVVAETPDGFVLRGEGMEEFLLPLPFASDVLARPQPPAEPEPVPPEIR